MLRRWSSGFVLCVALAAGCGSRAPAQGAHPDAGTGGHVPFGQGGADAGPEAAPGNADAGDSGAAAGASGDSGTDADAASCQELHDNVSFDVEVEGPLGTTYTGEAVVESSSPDRLRVVLGTTGVRVLVLAGAPGLELPTLQPGDRLWAKVEFASAGFSQLDEEWYTTRSVSLRASENGPLIVSSLWHALPQSTLDPAWLGVPVTFSPLCSYPAQCTDGEDTVYSALVGNAAHTVLEPGAGATPLPLGGIDYDARLQYALSESGASTGCFDYEPILPQFGMSVVPSNPADVTASIPSGGAVPVCAYANASPPRVAILAPGSFDGAVTYAGQDAGMLRFLVPATGKEIQLYSPDGDFPVPAVGTSFWLSTFESYEPVGPADVGIVLRQSQAGPVVLAEFRGASATLADKSAAWFGTPIGTQTACDYVQQNSCGGSTTLLDVAFGGSAPVVIPAGSDGHATLDGTSLHIWVVSAQDGGGCWVESSPHPGVTFIAMPD